MVLFEEGEDHAVEEAPRVRLEEEGLDVAATTTDPALDNRPQCQLCGRFLVLF
jgi:hypothetical protein